MVHWFLALSHPRTSCSTPTASTAPRPTPASSAAPPRSGSRWTMPCCWWAGVKRAARSTGRSRTAGVPIGARMASFVLHWVEMRPALSPLRRPPTSSWTSRMGRRWPPSLNSSIKARILHQCEAWPGLLPSHFRSLSVNTGDSATVCLVHAEMRHLMLGVGRAPCWEHQCPHRDEGAHNLHSAGKGQLWQAHAKNCAKVSSQIW
mmetsp:Transcript_182605/g.444564  ORF Transcript_182605/g.444564 Transcript_182605/m.444564 type:complete len:204 (-) Transcript_182605:115-726(-)